MTVLSIKVIAQANRRFVESTGPQSYKVHVTAPAQKGKANKEMIKLLAKHLGVTPAHLIISRGDRSNEKTVLVLEE